MRNDFESNYLMHHGILGQKWGRRNGPPYPLDASEYSSSEKKAKIANKTKSEYISKHQISKERTPFKTYTKSGVRIDVKDDKTSAVARFLARHSKNIADEQAKTRNMSIYLENKKIGDLTLYRESKESMNGVWLGINESERGNGYASAVMDAWIKYAKNNGYKQLTLEVPADSPDARHIYEKKGFIAGKIIDTGDVWGGSLTEMKMDLTKKKKIRRSYEK